MDNSDPAIQSAEIAAIHTTVTHLTDAKRNRARSASDVASNSAGNVRSCSRD